MGRGHCSPCVNPSLHVENNWRNSSDVGNVLTVAADLLYVSLFEQGIFIVSTRLDGSNLTTIYEDYISLDLFALTLSADYLFFIEEMSW